MVGIVVVSHSETLAEGVVALKCGTYDNVIRLLWSRIDGWTPNP